MDEVTHLFDLQSYANRRFDELSSGTKQRLSLAKSLLNDPRILFLDEPTIGLDPDVSLKTREIVLNILRERKMTVLLTSHNMDEVESMCERVAFIQKGRIIKLAAVDELKRLHHTDDLEKIFIQLAHQTDEHTARHPERSEGSQDASGFLTTLRLSPPPSGGLQAWLNRAYAFTMRSAIFSRRNLFVMTDVFFWPMISLFSIGLMAKFIQFRPADLRLCDDGHLGRRHFADHPAGCGLHGTL